MTKICLLSTLFKAGKLKLKYFNSDIRTKKINKKLSYVNEEKFKQISNQINFTQNYDPLFLLVLPLIDRSLFMKYY